MSLVFNLDRPSGVRYPALLREDSFCPSSMLLRMLDCASNLFEFFLPSCIFWTMLEVFMIDFLLPPPSTPGPFWKGEAPPFSWKGTMPTALGLSRSLSLSVLGLRGLLLLL